MPSESRSRVHNLANDNSLHCWAWLWYYNHRLHGHNHKRLDTMRGMRSHYLQMSQPDDRDKWINLSAIHENEVYDLQGKVAELQAENKRLRKAGNAMANCINDFRMGRWCNALDSVGGFRVWLNWKKAQATYLNEKKKKLSPKKPLTKHEDDIRRGLRTK